MSVVDTTIKLGSDGSVNCALSIGPVPTLEMMELVELFVSEINELMSSLMSLSNVYREDTTKRQAEKGGFGIKLEAGFETKDQRSCKLTEQQRRDIYQLHMNGVHKKVVASKYGITPQVVDYTVTRMSRRLKQTDNKSWRTI